MQQFFITNYFFDDDNDVLQMENMKIILGCKGRTL